MLIYPQLTTGALSQFPVARQRKARTIANATADGSSVKLGDSGGASTEWQLNYAGLSDAELAAMEQFFQAAEGSLNGFTFVDPTANLLAWSEVLNDSAWAADPLLTLQSGVSDPLGGANGWQLTNAGGGKQGLTQTLNAPVAYRYCLSVYVRAVQATSATLTVGTSQVACPVGTAWTRISAVGTGAATGASIPIGIAIPASSTVDVFGPQAEAQGTASHYQTSTTGGIYENARFRDDVLSVTTQAANRNSVTVNILYANHL